MFNFLIESITNGFLGILDFSLISLKGISSFFKQPKIDEEGFRSVFFDPNLRSYIGLYSSVSDFKVRFLEKPEELENLKKILDSLESSSEVEEASILKQFLNFFEGISVKETIDWSSLKETLKGLKGKFFFNFLNNFETKEEFPIGELPLIEIEKELKVIETKTELSETELKAVEEGLPELIETKKELSETELKAIEEEVAGLLESKKELSETELKLIERGLPGLLESKQILFKTDRKVAGGELPLHSRQVLEDHYNHLRNYIKGESDTLFCLVDKDNRTEFESFVTAYPHLYLISKQSPNADFLSLLGDGYDIGKALSQIKEFRMAVTFGLEKLQTDYIRAYKMVNNRDISLLIYDEYFSKKELPELLTMIGEMHEVKLDLLGTMEEERFDSNDYIKIVRKHIFSKKVILDGFGKEIKVKADSDHSLLVGESGSIQERINVMQSSQEAKKMTLRFGRLTSNTITSEEAIAIAERKKG